MPLSVRKRPSRTILVLLGWIVLLHGLQSCGDNSINKSEFDGEYFVAPPDPDTLVFYDLSDPPSLDPAKSWGFFDGRLIGLVFSNLIRFDRQAQIIPDTAARWELSSDGLRYTFHLNPAACFSFGRKIKSEDAVYSFQRIMDPATASPSSWIFEKVNTFHTPDAQTLIIELKEPFAPFLQMLAMPAASIVPREKVKAAELSGTPFGESPVGGGPWIFQEWKHDQELLFTRNELFWGLKPKQPNLKMRIISNPFTAIAEFETGNLAIIEPLPIPEILRWKSHPQWQHHVQTTPALQTEMLLFNCEKPYF
ncbi:MAG: ABC transporter substrate-binding protein, partial [bacterium]|nr:ABC transporter substrate-binding protein [bacterium]